MKLNEYDYNKKISCDLFIAAGGFEKRALTFMKKSKKTTLKINKAVLLRYLKPLDNNEKNFKALFNLVQEFTNDIEIIDIDIEFPDIIINRIKEKIYQISLNIKNKNTIVDISGMAHILICGCLFALDNYHFNNTIIYTEANDYFPQKKDWDTVVQAVEKKDFEIMAKYLQTAGLKDIQIPTCFKGNTRPGSKTSLLIMAGYEPNRVEGLVDDYAPNSLIVFYGKSPHRRLFGRQNLSKKLHQHVFDGLRYKEIQNMSTLQIDMILKELEKEYAILRQEYDVAITSQCSKMQTVASYLFWRRHPEIQLVFTLAVKIDAKRYSKGEGKTFKFSPG